MKDSVWGLAAFCLLLAAIGPALPAQEDAPGVPAIVEGDAGDVAPGAPAPLGNGAESVPFGDPQNAPPPNPLIQFAPFIIIILVFWLLIMRPQKKQQQRHRELVESLKNGDRVQTAGGIRGTVRGRNDERGTVMLEVAKDVRIEVAKSAVTGILDKEGSAVSESPAADQRR